jgi:hypothetical protein
VKGFTAEFRVEWWKNTTGWQLGHLDVGWWNAYQKDSLTYK